MEIEVKLPELGDGIKSGDILEVLVHVGDEVQKDQGILEVETDKATVTLPSSHTGRVSKILVKAGDSVPIGGVVLVLETVGGAAAPASAPAKSTPTPPTAPAIQTAPPPTAPVAPVPVKSAPVAPVVAAAPVAAAKPVAPAVPLAAPAPAAVAASNATPESTGSVAAGPAVRRFAREVGVDLQFVQGTGEGGRITRDDVLEAVRQANLVIRNAGATVPTPAATTGPTAASPAAAANTALADPAPSAPPVAPPAEGKSADHWGPIRVERMTKIRKTIAAKMHESWSNVPRVTNMDDADVTELERIRQASKDDYAARGIKLTSLPFVIKSVAMALRKNPVVNASLDLDNGSIIYKDYVHIGIAVDSERGLVVPALRNVDQLSIPEIARQVALLADKVRDNQFAIDDLRGSTFSISNLGAVGGTYATPIVNTPEVAILLLGRARKLPVVVNDEIVPRLMLPLSLSYDHRLVDGAAAARFLNDVIGYLKAPGRLLLAP